jgi:hypothetical protein
VLVLSFRLGGRERVALSFPLFLRYQAFMAKLKRTLDKKPEGKKPPYVMPEPNDDAAAFGWSLDKLRYPAETSTKTDVWPGASIFQIEEENALRDQYGFDINFVNAKFVQVVLDQDPAVRAAAEKCAAAKYTPDAIADLRKVIVKAFNEQVVPQMLARFKKVAKHVAEFYAARLAHLETFGPDEGYIDASTMKSRR